MTKKWIAINLMMLVAAGLLGWQLYVSVDRFNHENSVANLTKAQAAKKKAAPEAGLLPQRPDTKINEADYAVIPAQTVFAEIRRIESQVDNTPPPEPPRKLDVIPILVGVTIAGSQKMAVINDPAAGNSPGASRIQRMRVGDNYRGFVVTDITDSGMVLEYGSSREIIPLYDTSKQPQAGKTPILATRVVNFGGTTAVAPGSFVVTSASAGAARPQAAPGAAPAAGRTTQPANAQRPVAIGGANAVPTNVSGAGGGAMTPGPTWNSSVDAQGRVIVNSPFGAFTLPNAQQTAPPIKK
jgi:hypothetical protein